MVLDNKNIEQLIEKYENAETTIQEEQQLKNYFSKETVAPHLEVYKPMFAYFLHTQNEEFTKDVPLTSKKTNTLYQWISVAAIAILMFGVYFTQVNNEPRTLADLNQEELQTYDEAMEALAMLSSNFKKGTDNLSAMTLVSESLNQGQENLAYLGEFDNTTDKIINYD